MRGCLGAVSAWSSFDVLIFHLLCDVKSDLPLVPESFKLQHGGKRPELASSPCGLQPASLICMREITLGKAEV